MFLLYKIYLFFINKLYLNKNLFNFFFRTNFLHINKYTLYKTNKFQNLYIIFYIAKKYKNLKMVGFKFFLFFLVWFFFYYLNNIKKLNLLSLIKLH